MTTNKYTPKAPFTTSNYTEHHSEIYDAEDYPICTIKNGNMAKVKTFKKFILSRLNSHDALVELAQCIIYNVDNGPNMKQFGLLKQAAQDALKDTEE